MDNSKKEQEISLVVLSDLTNEANMERPAQEPKKIEKLADLKVEITAVLGMKKATVGEIETYKEGSIIEVERTPGHLMDVFIGDEKIAVGEIVPMDNQFALVVSEVEDKRSDILNKMKKHGDDE